MNSILSNLPNFRFEGPAFEVEAGSTNVYRFLNTDAGVHFYTTSEVERGSIIENLSNFNFEGAAYTIDGTGTDVHRYLNTQTGTHFFTQSAAEKANIDANLPHLQYEGVAYQASDRSDHLKGTDGDDLLDTRADFGSSTGERDIFALNGNDTIKFHDADRVHGGNGDDQIIAVQSVAAGTTNTQSTIHGGNGADQFVFIVEYGETGAFNLDVSIADFNFDEGDRVRIVQFNPDVLIGGFGDRQGIATYTYGELSDSGPNSATVTITFDGIASTNSNFSWLSFSQTASDFI